MKYGFDTVALTVDEWKRLVPPGAPPDVIGTYGNGHYANHTVAKQAVPTAICVVYDVNGSMPECDLLDIEPRDAVPNDAHGWSQRWRAAKVGRVLSAPGLYASASSTSQVISDMLDNGWKRNQFLIQSAHYGRGAHLCGPDTCHYPQADSTQYADKGPQGQNIDLTIWADHCFVAAWVPNSNARYELFDNTQRFFGRERALVIEYDKYRAQQTRHRLRLRWLEYRLMWAAFRLAALGHPERFNRRWRQRELEDRAAGRRLV